MRETAAFCHACGQVIEGAGILFTEHGDRICVGCAPTLPSGVDLARARLVALNAQMRRRRRTRVALATLWVAAGAFAAGSIRTMPPVFMVDSPGAGSVVAGEIRLSGRVAVQTIREPAWLFVGAHAASCLPVEKVPILISSDGQWQSRVELKGRRGARFWLTAVVSNEAGRAAPDAENERIPEWLWRHAPEEQGGRGCRRQSRADWRPPADATVLASFDLTLAEDHALNEIPPRLGAIFE